MKKPIKAVCLSVLVCGTMLIGTQAFAQVGGAAGASGSTPGLNTGAKSGVGPAAHLLLDQWSRDYSANNAAGQFCSYSSLRR